MEAQNQAPQTPNASIPPAPQNVAPTPAAPTQNKSNDSEANKLCIISIACRYGGPALSGIFGTMFGGLAEASGSDTLETAVALPLAFILLGSRLASWILVIMARVKYKEATFPKVLLIIYIIGVVLTLIAFIAIIAIFAKFMSDCAQSF